MNTPSGPVDEHGSAPALRGDPRPLHAQVEGSGEPPVVLLHGFGASAFSWRHWTPALAKRHRTLTVDFKGFGRAEKPDDDGYRPIDQAEHLRRFLVEEDVRDATLVGHSLGGGLALLTALLLADAGEEDRLGRMVLVSAAAYPQALPPIMGALKIPGLGAALTALVPPTLTIRLALRHIVHRKDDVTEAQVRGYAEPFRDPAARRAAIRTVRRLLDDDPDRWIARFGEIGKPVLLLWGEHDRVVPPAFGRRLAADLPHSRLLIMPECGHLPAEEHPKASLETLLDFLEETSGAPSR